MLRISVALMVLRLGAIAVEMGEIAKSIVLSIIFNNFDWPVGLVVRDPDC